MAKQAELSFYEKLEKEIPKIIAQTTKKGQDFMHDDKSLKNALIIAHEFLPLPIRLVISAEKFTEFCMTHKERFFGKNIKKPKPVKKTVSPKIATKTPALPAKKIAAPKAAVAKPVAAKPAKKVVVAKKK